MITWDADGKYGQAWHAWADSAVRDARATMLSKKKAAFAADDKLRAAQSERYEARRTLSSCRMAVAESVAKRASRLAWNEYYKSQQQFEAAYEQKFKAAPKGQSRLTFEIWLVFNVNGNLPQSLPPPVSAAFGFLAGQPVNHFLRVQRSNYPGGQTMGTASAVLPPYPTDAAAAEAIVGDIFLTRPREHASMLPQIEKLAVVSLRALLLLAAAAAVLAAYAWFRIGDAETRRLREERAVHEIANVIERLEKLAGQKGGPAGDLDQATEALKDAARDVEGKIIGLNEEIRDLTGQLELAFGRMGLDAPACWGAKHPDRRVRYLFEIELREDEATPMRVTRVPIKHPPEEIGRGPFAGKTIGENYSSSFEAPPVAFPLGEWISAKRFSTGVAGPVNKLYDSLGSENTCRHYVRLCDHSYRTKDAESYKQLLALVQGTFYTYRPRASTCGASNTRRGVSNG